MNTDNKQVIIITTTNQLEETFQKFAERYFQKPEPEHEPKDRMTRRQAAKFMDVSYQTMYNYTKAGIIKEHGTTGKKFYLKKELIEVIKNNS